MVLTKVMTRGQVTLPRRVREVAGCRAGDVVAIEVTGPGTIEMRVLPRLRLADLLQRYPIEVPIDEAKDRAAWQRAATEEVLGSRDAD